MGVVKRPHSRYNGWSWPPHPFQFIAWGCFHFFIVLHFTTICPALQSRWRIPVYVIGAILFSVHYVVHIVACSVNPADAYVRLKMKGCKAPPALPTLDRSKHAHAIENQHCYLCEVDVSPSAKHCSACNKCVSGFDHHCKWLNNCVGNRNYRLFITTVATALVASLFLISFCLILFIAYFTDQSAGRILQTYHDSRSSSQHTNSSHIPLNASSSAAILSFQSTTVVPSAILSTTSSQSDDLHIEFRLCYATVPDAAWLSVMMVSAVLNLFAIALLLHLLCFHCFLMYKGLSTYGYIVAGRKQDEELARNQNNVKNGNSFAGLECAKPGKSNQIVPHADEDDVYEQPAHRLQTLPTRSITPPLPVFLTPTRVRKEMNGLNSQQHSSHTTPQVDFMQPMNTWSELANGHLRPIKVTKRKCSKHQHRKTKMDKADSKEESDMTAGSVSGVSVHLPPSPSATAMNTHSRSSKDGTWGHSLPRPLPRPPDVNDLDNKGRSLTRSVSSPGSNDHRRQPQYRPPFPRWPPQPPSSPPAVDDSVESLHEIPVHSTLAGSMRQRSSPETHQVALTLEELATWRRTEGLVDVHYEMGESENNTTLV